MIQLDAHQEQVAAWQRGWAVCSAAAGSGKSTCCIERTVRLLRVGCPPRRIAVLVYNREAADTFLERLQQAHVQGRQVVVSTFHSWCYGLLRHWYPQEGRFLPSRILGGDGGAVSPGDLVFPLKDMKDAQGRHSYPLAAGLDEILKASDLLSECLIDLRPGARPLTAEEVADVGRLLNTEGEGLERWINFLRAFSAAREAARVITFADMTFLVAHAMQTAGDQPHVAALQQLFDHVMVDEAQDLNPARLVIARYLLERAHSGLFVGDPRQAIYGFCGAVDGVLQSCIEAGAALLTLPVNRRSSEAVIDLANAVAEGQSWNLGGSCQARPGAPKGQTPVWYRDLDAEAAADSAARLAEDALAAGKTVAILCRVNEELLQVEAACLRQGLSVQTLGERGGAWESSVARLLYAYLAGAAGVVTSEMFTVLNLPKRFGKRKALYAAIQGLRGRPAAAFHGAITRSPDRGVSRFGKDLQTLAALPWEKQVEQAAQWLKRGIMDAEGDKRSVALTRCDALDVIQDHALTLGSLQAIDDHRKASGKVPAARHVTLSSIHRAKGQEWDLVIGWKLNAKLLPHRRADDKGEERRLFYVLVTRARQQLVLFSTTGDKGKDKPSPFLKEPGIVACLSEP